MHRLVQRQRQEAATEGSELPLPSLGWRFGWLIQVLLAERLEQLQVPLPQFEILLAHLGERWIRGGIIDYFRVLTEVLLPLGDGMLVSEAHYRDQALHQCEV